MAGTFAGMFRELSKTDIDNIIVELMIRHGPDQHCDGHEVITEFVWLLAGRFFGLAMIEESAINNFKKRYLS